MLCFSNVSIPVSSTMFGAEKAVRGGGERRKPFVSCIRLNGVPILPPLMDKSTKTMVTEAKNRALQLEMQLGWTPGDRKQNCAEKLAVRRRGNAVSQSFHSAVGGRGGKEIRDAVPQCTCNTTEQPRFPRQFKSAPCLTDASPWRVWPDSAVDRPSIFHLSKSARSVKTLRKCSSVENLPLREWSENKSFPECARCRRGGERDPVVVSGSRQSSSERPSCKSSRVRSPAKGRNESVLLITYMKGGCVVSTESELSVSSASPQKHRPSRESDNSTSDSTWAAGFYRQLFPLENEEDRNFDSESSEDGSVRRILGTADLRGGSQSASSDYVSARESGATMLDVPTDGGFGGYRLVRQGSYVLEKPSEALLDHLKRQSSGGSDSVPDRAVEQTKETSVQTDVDELELSDAGDDTADSGGSSKVSELREKLRKSFDAAMEALLERQRCEQEALARAFLRRQQSAQLQMKASAVINAAARGYLIRRLMRTKHVQDLIETMEESLKCIFELKGESLRPLRADQELYDRLLQQLTAACSTFYETFFDITTAERMKIIAADRERLKYLQLKAASLGLHSTRPATR